MKNRKEYYKKYYKKHKLEIKDVDKAQNALEQLKRQVNILWEMIKKGVFNKCID